MFHQRVFFWLNVKNLEISVLRRIVDIYRQPLLIDVTVLLFNWRVYLVRYLTHYFFFGLFSYSYTLSVTVLTLWVARPKMFYSLYRI